MPLKGRVASREQPRFPMKEGLLRSRMTVHGPGWQPTVQDGGSNQLNKLFFYGLLKEIVVMPIHFGFKWGNQT